MEIKQYRSRLTVQAVRYTKEQHHLIAEWLRSVAPSYYLAKDIADVLWIKHRCSSVSEGHNIAVVEEGKYIAVSNYGVSCYDHQDMHQHLYEEIDALSSS